MSLWICWITCIYFLTSILNFFLHLCDTVPSTLSPTCIVHVIMCHLTISQLPVRVTNCEGFFVYFLLDVLSCSKRSGFKCHFWQRHLNFSMSSKSWHLINIIFVVSIPRTRIHQSWKFCFYVYISLSKSVTIFQG